MRAGHWRHALSLSLVMALAACADQGSPDTGRTIADSTSSTATEAPSTSAPSSTLPPVIDCPGGGEFGEGSDVAAIDDQGSDATRLSHISWEITDQCETFVFAFETAEGAPATAVPEVEIFHLDSHGVLRVRMGIESTVIADQLVESDLVERLYVVQALDGGMFVDMHLAAAAAARARADASPARLVIDLRPGLVELAGGAATHPDVVVVSPISNVQVTPSVSLTGYSRTFEANVLIIVTQADEVAVETNTTAAGYVETWGEFRTDLELPSGDVSVFVGEASPEDGSLDGVTIDLLVN